MTPARTPGVDGRPSTPSPLTGRRARGAAWSTTAAARVDRARAGTGRATSRRPLAPARSGLATRAVAATPRRWTGARRRRRPARSSAPAALDLGELRGARARPPPSESGSPTTTARPRALRPRRRWRRGRRERHPIAPDTVAATRQRCAASPTPPPRSALAEVEPEDRPRPGRVAVRRPLTRALQRAPSSERSSSTPRRPRRRRGRRPSPVRASRPRRRRRRAAGPAPPVGRRRRRPSWRRPRVRRAPSGAPIRPTAPAPAARTASASSRSVVRVEPVTRDDHARPRRAGQLRGLAHAQGARARRASSSSSACSRSTERDRRPRGAPSGGMQDRRGTLRRPRSAGESPRATGSPSSPRSGGCSRRSSSPRRCGTARSSRAPRRACRRTARPRPRPASTTRTTSPYFSPKKAIAPDSLGLGASVS